ncbi:hypothetical protein Z043_118767, partial [Scleropages formosus]
KNGNRCIKPKWGSSPRFAPFRRGRQGCPTSPYLFLVVSQLPSTHLLESKLQGSLIAGQHILIRPPAVVSSQISEATALIEEFSSIVTPSKPQQKGRNVLTKAGGLSTAGFAGCREEEGDGDEEKRTPACGDPRYPSPHTRIQQPPRARKADPGYDARRSSGLHTLLLRSSPA